jgi:probable F420-dependent oxidoreductase
MLGAPEDAVLRAAELHALGISGVYTFEGPNDPFVPLIRVAGEVDVDLMTNVAIAFPRNPMQLAHLAFDLQRLAGGRFTLGLGSQIRPHIERRYGVEFDHPVARMREWVEALRAIFDRWQHGTPLEYTGRFTHHTLMTPMFDPGPLSSGPPAIHLGAVGPQMTAMAAAVADGILTHPFTSYRFLHDVTFPAIDRSLAKGDRSPSQLEIVGQSLVAVAGDETEQAEADAAVRGMLGFYGSTPAYRPVLEAEGWEDLQPELRKLTKEGRWDDLAAVVDDTMLSTLAVRGTPEQVADGLRERFGARADRVAVTMPYGVRDDTLGDLVDAVGV